MAESLFSRPCSTPTAEKIRKSGKAFGPDGAHVLSGLVTSLRTGVEALFPREEGGDG